MAKRNFALVGEIGSGKDTVASYMSGYVRKAFGDQMKLVARNLRVNGVEAAYCQLCKLFKLKPPSDLWRNLEDMQRLPIVGEKDRLLLQELGTYCRESDNKVWIRPVMNSISKDSNYVITDVRYPLEFKEVVKAGFVTVYIASDLDSNIERVKKRDGAVDLSAFKHKAEADIQNLRPLCEIEINNTGTLEKLKEQVEGILFIYNF